MQKIFAPLFFKKRLLSLRSLYAASSPFVSPLYDNTLM
jgi:hypothetical protein